MFGGGLQRCSGQICLTFAGPVHQPDLLLTLNMCLCLREDAAVTEPRDRPPTDTETTKASTGPEVSH